MSELVEEMRSAGVDIIVHKGSVLDKSTLELIKTQAKDWPIRGIVQGAMVLQVSLYHHRDE